MRWFCFFLCLFLTASLSAQEKKTSEQKKDNAIVKAVLDGDCVKVRMLDFYGKETTKEVVYYISGIDAPDRGQPDYAMALEFLKKRIEGVKVRVVPVTESPLYLSTAELYHNNLSLSETMILSGMAWPSPYTRNKKAKQYQGQAVQAKLGMWQEGRSPDAPWEFRAKVKSVKVVEVISGDAFTIGKDHPLQIVKLYGVAAPWPYDPAYKVAREYLKRQIEGKEVQIEVKEDYRQVLVAKVKLAGKDPAAEMLGKGLIWYNQLKALTESQLDAAASSAQKANLGIWKRADTRPPWTVCKQPKNIEEWFIPKEPEPPTAQPETLVRLYKQRKTPLPFTLKDVMITDASNKATWSIAISVSSKTRKRPKIHYVQLGKTIPGAEDWKISDVGFQEKPHPKLKGMTVKEFFIKIQHTRRSSRTAVLIQGVHTDDPLGEDLYQLAYFPTGKTITVSLDQEFKLAFKELKSVCVLRKSIEGAILLENTSSRERCELKKFDRNEFIKWKAEQTEKK